MGDADFIWDLLILEIKTPAWYSFWENDRKRLQIPMFSALEGLKTQTTPFFAKKTQKKKYQALLFMRRTYMVISPSQLGINRYCGLLFLGDPIQDYRLYAINPQINIGYRLSITTLFGLTSIVSYNALLLDCYSRNLWVDNILGDILLAKG